MATVIMLILNYAYIDFIFMLFLKSTLGIKYSVKTIGWATTGLWIFQCFAKLFPYFTIGIDLTIILNTVVFASYFVYVLAFFESSFWKKILAMILGFIVQIVMDMIGINITGMLFGNYLLMQTDSYFMMVACIISGILISIGMYVLNQLWKFMQKKNWKIEKYAWLCLLFPISQYVMFQYIVTVYSLELKEIPEMIVLGMLLGIMADIYMFILFFRLSEKERAQAELVRIEHQYEMEKIKYEQLNRMQTEAAKIRHDFQSYIIMMKSLDNN